MSFHFFFFPSSFFLAGSFSLGAGMRCSGIGNPCAFICITSSTSLLQLANNSLSDQVVSSAGPAEPRHVFIFYKQNDEFSSKLSRTITFLLAAAWYWQYSPLFLQLLQLCFLGSNIPPYMICFSASPETAVQQRRPGHPLSTSCDNQLEVQQQLCAPWLVWVVQETIWPTKKHRRAQADVTTASAVLPPVAAGVDYWRRRQLATVALLLASSSN